MMPNSNRDKRKRLLSPDEHKYLLEVIKSKDKDIKTITNLINNKFNRALTYNQVRSYFKNRGLKCGVDKRFKKGDTPNPKTYEGLAERGKNTRFKKGNKPWNIAKVGEKRVTTDGYVKVKLEEPNVWAYEHRLNWESVNGVVPSGYCLIFLDSDPLNTDLSNLELVKRSELSYMNQKSLLTTDAEITKLGLAVTRLDKAIIQKEA